MFNTVTYAQKLHVVANADTKTVIPYAIVQAKGSTTGLYTDDKGQFRNSFNSKDVLVIRSMGYTTTELHAGKLPDTIYLHATSHSLGEVVVSAQPKPQKTVDNFTNKHKIRSFGGSAGIEQATRLDFPNADKSGLKKINQVKIRMKMDKQSNPARLHLYNVAPDGTPGEGLLNKTILITAKDIKGKLCIKDIAAENVYTTDSGVYIGIEYVGQIYSKDSVIVRDPNQETKSSFKPTHAFLLMTTAHAKANTYTRTVFYRNWVHFNFPTEEGGNPLNLMVGVTYE